MVSLETIVFIAFGHQAKHISIRAKVDSLLFTSLTECTSCLPRIQTFFDNLYTVFINETSQDVGARQCRYVIWNGAWLEWVGIFRVLFSTLLTAQLYRIVEVLSLKLLASWTKPSDILACAQMCRVTHDFVFTVKLSDTQFGWLGRMGW